MLGKGFRGIATGYPLELQQSSVSDGYSLGEVIGGRVRLPMRRLARSLGYRIVVYHGCGLYSKLHASDQALLGTYSRTARTFEKILGASS